MPVTRASYYLALFGLFLTLCTDARAQTTLVLNGAAIVLSDSATLVIANGQNTAIQRNGSGYILSEGANNRVIWTIGSGNGSTYIIPFGSPTQYLPLSFRAAAGTPAIGVAGSFVFSTFPTTPVNSASLPPAVTNMTITNGDNSITTIDRFWQLTPQGYTTAPSLTDLTFTYSDAELAAPNTISEGDLTAWRWNGPLQHWNDYTSGSAINTLANTVTVPTVTGGQLHDWWTLADAHVPQSVTLVFFNAKPVFDQVLTSWETATENNSDHFEVWRSSDSVQFELVGKVTATGNSSTIHDYSFTDEHPLNAVSYYRLKIIAKDGTFIWSPIVRVDLGNNYSLRLYPSPATTTLTIGSSPDLVARHPLAGLFDMQGKQLKVFPLNSTSQQIDISGLAKGIYQLKIIYSAQTTTLRFIKL